MGAAAAVVPSLLLLPLLLLQFVHSSAVKSAAHDVSDQSNRCAWQMEGEADRKLMRFSALPGTGWDNLRNKEMAQVSDMRFSDCKLSDDGQYILPKSVILAPRKESRVSVNTEVMEHYNNYTDSLSVTVNAGGKYFYVGISGKFSDEYQRVKSIAVHSKTQIARAQMRYHVYTARLQADSQLSPAFTDRMIGIANAIVNNNSREARYLSDLVVRDFGTHAITSVDAGGMLEKTDFFDKNSITTKDFMQNAFSIAMSKSFHNLIGVDFSAKITVTKAQLDEYMKSVKKSAVTTHGGPVMGAQMNVSKWERQLLNNLVAIDRDGVPLSDLISQRSLPGVPAPHLMQLIGHVRDAIQRYYKANMIKGCQNPNSANFDPSANIDGHCETLNTNFSFGGVYQTCKDNNPGAGLALCNGETGMQQKNPITGDYQCPPAYEPVKLLQQTGTTKRQCKEKHRRCWGFFSCRDGESCVQSSTTITAFWCSVRATAHPPKDSGMVYAGMFSKKLVNPVTNSRSCPPFYRPFRLGSELFLCLSRDFSAATKIRVPLGGFFSCKSGNPLAEPGRKIVSASWLGAASSGVAGFNDFPKRCPDGFSQITVDIFDGCSLMICEKFPGELGRQFPKRPPFESPDFVSSSVPVVQVSDGIRIWNFNLSTQLWAFSGFLQQPIKSSNSNPPQPLSPDSNSATVTVLLVSVLVATLLTVVVAIGYARYKRSRHLFQPLAAGYGSVGNGQESDGEIDVSA